MRADSRCGFNVIELAAVTAVVMLLVCALAPLVTYKVFAANTTRARTNGRDIYVAIVGANTEREALALPPVWPSDEKPFTNSTDYFRDLFDGEHLGTASWNPLVAGCDYSKLTAAGVRACTNGKLTPENNMWTVAMNVRRDTPDVVPVLVTRNIDASSLAAKVTGKDWNRPVRFDPEWMTPFGDQGYCLVRKSGAGSRIIEKFRTYGTLYEKKAFDTTVDEHGKPVEHPLKYLTPSRTVVPGEQAYAEGAVRVAREVGGGGKRLLRVFVAAKDFAVPVGFVCLLVAVAYGVRQGPPSGWPRRIGCGLGAGLLHAAAVVLWYCQLFADSVSYSGNPRMLLLAMAVLTQIGGVAFVMAWLRDDRAARVRGVKWMVAAPLVCVGMLFLFATAGGFR